MDQKNLVDRTTRLAVTLTVFGGAWFLFKGVFKLWFSTFSEIAYIRGLLNFEHIISILLLIMMVRVMLTVLNYIYLELMTYRNIDNEVDINSIKKADKAFDKIFETIKSSTIMIVVVMILSFLLLKIKLFNFMILIVIGVIFGFIFKIKFNKKIFNIKNNRISAKFKSNLEKVINFFYLLFITLYISIFLIVISLENDQEVKVDFKETDDLPLEISLLNIEDPEININIYRNSDLNNNIHLILQKEDLYQTIVEVLETSETESNLLIKEEKDEKVTLSKNKYFYFYSDEIKKYLMEGKNTVEVIIFSNGYTKKKVRFVTPIIVNGQDINIYKKKFNIEI